MLNILNNKQKKFFEKNRYVVVKNALSQEIISFIKDSWNRMDEEPYSKSIFVKEGKHVDGSIWSKPFITSEYGISPFGVSTLTNLQKIIEKNIEIELIPTYSFERKYWRDAVLYSHRDRPSCEISATITIDYVTDNKEPWPIWILNDKNYAGFNNANAFAVSQSKNEDERIKAGCKRILIYPGDILVYQGVNVLHWRDPLDGEWARQIFVHYVNKNGPFYQEFPELEFDGRKSLYHTYDDNYRNYKVVKELNETLANDVKFCKERACKGISEI